MKASKSFSAMSKLLLIDNEESIRSLLSINQALAKGLLPSYVCLIGSAGQQDDGNITQGG
jgi:hypothetical protein